MKNKIEDKPENMSNLENNRNKRKNELERQKSLLKAQYMVFFQKRLSLIRICFSAKVIFCNKTLTLING